MSHYVKVIFSLVIFGCLHLCSGVAARADLIIVASDMPSPVVVADFSQFAGLAYIPTAGPVQIGNQVGLDIVFTSTNVNSVIGDARVTGGYGLNLNGIWENRTHVGLNVQDPGAAITFRFNNGPVRAVGGFINYVRGTDAPTAVVISALGFDNSLLETYNLVTLAPIVTPNSADAGAFRGIVRPDADIFGFSLSNAGVVLDDLTFSSATTPDPIPEPAALLLLGTGLAGLTFGVRKRRD